MGASSGTVCFVVLVPTCRIVIVHYKNVKNESNASVYAIGKLSSAHTQPPLGTTSLLGSWPHFTYLNSYLLILFY